MTDERSTRINAIADELQSNIRAALECVLQLDDLEVSPADILALIKSRADSLNPAQKEQFTLLAMDMMPTWLTSLTSAPQGMEAHVEKLFHDRGKKIDGKDTPAVEDVTIVLRTFPQVVNGVLSKTPTGCLKLGSVGQAGPGGPMLLVEQVFDVDDVLWIATTSEISSGASSIITSH